MCALAFSSGASERWRNGKLYACQTCVRNISEERLRSLPIPRCPVLFLTRPQTAVSHTRVLAVRNDILKPHSQHSVPALPLSPCTSAGWWLQLCWGWAGGAGCRALLLLPSRQGCGGGGPSSPPHCFPWFPSLLGWAYLFPPLPGSQVCISLCICHYPWVVFYLSYTGLAGQIPVPLYKFISFSKENVA